MSTPPPSGPAGFLSRWSQRKLQAKAEPAPTQAPASVTPVVAEADAAASRTLVQPQSHAPQAAASPVAPPAATKAPAVPPPTLADLEPLDHTADLTRFVARGVEESVRRAALRKLFADPQFNVMDGLDTYIDDYNTPSPVPPGFLARLKSAPDLGLMPPSEPTAAQPQPTPAAPPAQDAAPAVAPCNEPPPAPAPQAAPVPCAEPPCPPSPPSA